MGFSLLQITCRKVERSTELFKTQVLGQLAYDRKGNQVNSIRSQPDFECLWDLELFVQILLDLHEAHLLAIVRIIWYTLTMEDMLELRLVAVEEQFPYC